MDVDRCKEMRKCYNCGETGHCKVLQTKKGEERGSEGHRENKGGFFPGQGVSTKSPTFIDLKVQLPEESMRDFLDYFGARNYETNKGYSTEWIAKKIQWSNDKETIGILKV